MYLNSLNYIFHIANINKSQKKYLLTNNENKKNAIIKNKNSNISKQIENLFLYFLLKSMRKNCFKNELWINSNQESMYQDIYDQYITQIYSKNNIGLSKIIDDYINFQNNKC